MTTEKELLDYIEKEGKQFKRWNEIIDGGCDSIESSDVISIPVRIPNCKETGNPCRYDTCPRITPQRR